MSIKSAQFDRTRLLIGREGLEKLFKSRIAIFGIGGVGSYAIEALARSGIGRLDLFDDDIVCITNLNRQIIAAHSTLGRYKADVAMERILDINPDAIVESNKVFYSKETAEDIDFSVYDYIIDAIDTVSSKIELVVRAKAKGIPVISSMGAGNKMDPSAFTVDDIYNTTVCPLARVMRKLLKEKGIESLKVVYSKEVPLKPLLESGAAGLEKTPGSNAFVPSAAGLVIAGEVIRDLVGEIVYTGNRV